MIAGHELERLPAVPQFVSAIPAWSVGDRVIVGAEARYRIVGIAYDEAHDETTWTVEPVRSGH